MKYPEFNPQKDKEKIVKFIQDWFYENGNTAKAIIGISGGKDFTIVASLCGQRLPLANAEVGACGNENFRRNLLSQLH